MDDPFVIQRFASFVAYWGKTSTTQHKYLRRRDWQEGLKPSHDDRRNVRMLKHQVSSFRMLPLHAIPNNTNYSIKTKSPIISASFPLATKTRKGRYRIRQGCCPPKRVGSIPRDCRHAKYAKRESHDHQEIGCVGWRRKWKIDLRSIKRDQARGVYRVLKSVISALSHSRRIRGVTYSREGPGGRGSPVRSW